MNFKLLLCFRIFSAIVTSAWSVTPSSPVVGHLATTFVSTLNWNKSPVKQLTRMVLVSTTIRKTCFSPQEDGNFSATRAVLPLQKRAHFSTTLRSRTERLWGRSFSVSSVRMLPTCTAFCESIMSECTPRHPELGPTSVSSVEKPSLKRLFWMSMSITSTWERNSSSATCAPRSSIAPSPTGSTRRAIQGSALTFACSVGKASKWPTTWRSTKDCTQGRNPTNASSVRQPLPRRTAWTCTWRNTWREKGSVWSQEMDQGWMLLMRRALNGIHHASSRLPVERLCQHWLCPGTSSVQTCREPHHVGAGLLPMGTPGCQSRAVLLFCWLGLLAFSFCRQTGFDLGSFAQTTCRCSNHRDWTRHVTLQALEILEMTILLTSKWEM